MRIGRYVFWFLVCGVFADLLANKTGGPCGWGGELGAFIYGGVNGLGLALATSRNLSWRLHFRFLAAAGWTVFLIVFYSLIFAPAGLRRTNVVLLWGLIFGLPAALIAVLRGIPAAFANSK